MSYIVFARKYRPNDFDQIVGQEHITTTLKNAITQDRVAHAYLFAGPRGVGKTTAARIFSKALNCEKGPTPRPCSECVSCREISSGVSMDVIEIDGASNRGIDEVRTLRENVKFAPSHGRYKVYIIDEVHMLTQEAFNALLKTLEEPPRHVKFIFATTHPNKVLATVSSRCQRFDFRRITVNQIVSKLKEIAKGESIKADEEVLFSIARQADGSLRDAESILDQLNTFCSGEIRKEDIARILGTVSEDEAGEFMDMIIKRDAPAALLFIDRLVKEGKDLSFFISNIVEHIRDIIAVKVCRNPGDIIGASPLTLENLARQARDLTQEELFYISSVLMNASDSMKRAASARVIFEMAVVKIAARSSLAGLEEVLDKIEALQKRIETGAADVRRPSVSPKNSGDTIPNSDITGGLSIMSPEFPEKPADKKEEPPDAGENAVSVSLPEIEQAWPAFLNVLKSRKMSAASYLLEGSPSSCENGVLTVVFPKNYSLHKEALERPDNRLIVEKALEGVLQRRVKIVFVTNSEKKEDAGADRKEQPQDSPRQEMIKEPIIQSALEALDGRIVHRNSK